MKHNGDIMMTMRIFILTCFLYGGLISIAQAQVNIDDGIRQPKAMMVAGDSIIDDSKNDNTSDATANVIAPKDDAKSMMNGESAAPVVPTINPFQPAPQTSQQDIKRVVKKIPAAESNRSIADDRIDDGYVQEMIEKNFSYNPNMTDID